MKALEAGALETALGHQFDDRSLLESALIHTSYQSEHPETFHNERLEFLGDAVLALAVTTFVFREFEDMPEGEMAKVRAAVVNREELGGVARNIELGRFVLLGRGEESTGGREKPSILADTMEALIGAVYLDAGYEKAANMVIRHWEGRIRETAARPGGADYKTRLQEVLAATGLKPEYQVVGAGPDHAKQFTALVYINGECVGKGVGPSKREAEQDAAQAALSHLASR
ncbi:MAG: ribonuclease III [Actinomycetota bacterium]